MDTLPGVQDIVDTVLTDETKFLRPYTNSPATDLILPIIARFLLLVLSVQKHAPATTKTLNEEYDYVVVGAGSAGATVAARLSEKSCVNVLLLEAGRLPPRMTDLPGVARIFAGTEIDWAYYTEPQKFTGNGLIENRLNFPAGKVVGGSSIWNAMLFVRGSRKIFDEWEAGGAENWSYEHVLPYFKKLEHNMNPEFVEPEYHGSEGPVTFTKPVFTSPLKKAIEESFKSLGYSAIDINGRYTKGFYDYQSNTRRGQRCSTAKAYLVPADKRKNLHIKENAYVTKILIKDNRAVGVQYNSSGKLHQVRAKKGVILSAGTTNSPQLLMLSGIGPKDHLEELKIPVLADLPVGKNLMDHIGPLVNYYSDKLSRHIDEVYSPRAFVEYLFFKGGQLATSEAVQYLALLTNDRKSPPDAIPDYELFFLDGVDQIAERTFNLKPEVYKAVYKPYKNKATLWCICQSIHSKSRGFVKLRSSDPYDSPIIDPNYFSDPQDLEDVVEGMIECDRIILSKPFEKLGVKSFETKYPGCEKLFNDRKKYYKCQAQSHVITLSHQAGTVKMGNPEDKSTVVDSRLRVKDIQNLRVVDASVMPLVTTGNTNVPTIMIAEKAADMIKEDEINEC